MIFNLQNVVLGGNFFCLSPSSRIDATRFLLSFFIVKLGCVRKVGEQLAPSLACYTENGHNFSSFTRQNLKFYDRAEYNKSLEIKRMEKRKRLPYLISLVIGVVVSLLIAQICAISFNFLQASILMSRESLHRPPSGAKKMLFADEYEIVVMSNNGAVYSAEPVSNSAWVLEPDYKYEDLESTQKCKNKESNIVDCYYYINFQDKLSLEVVIMDDGSVEFLSNFAGNSLLTLYFGVISIFISMILSVALPIIVGVIISIRYFVRYRSEKKTTLPNSNTSAGYR